MRKTIDFKKFSIDLVNEWLQFKNIKRYNWLSMNLLHFYFERDQQYGNYEIEFYFLGFGIRIYWSYTNPEIEKNLKEIRSIIDKSKELWDNKEDEEFDN